ncbi:DUF3237 domain-containing protein [Kitasatospora sp. NPDC051853]|uniref:DUF3237 domain-containing protein n=1 Tax=Kitasatospora sp. NPDC051853 TaxID=3364058 RepID=UPI00378B73E4
MNLEPLADFTVQVATPLDLGPSPQGHRRIVPVTGGHFTGPDLRGEILPGGADWQLLHPDGTIAIDTRYTLRTDDGAHLHLTTTGLRHGPPEVLRDLAAGREVPSSAYYFRLFCRFESGDHRYQWLTHTLAVATATRTPDAVRYAAYALT